MIHHIPKQKEVKLKTQRTVIFFFKLQDPGKYHETPSLVVNISGGMQDPTI